MIDKLLDTIKQDQRNEFSMDTPNYNQYIIVELLENITIQLARQTLGKNNTHSLQSRYLSIAVQAHSRNQSERISASVDVKLENRTESVHVDLPAPASGVYGSTRDTIHVAIVVISTTKLFPGSTSLVGDRVVSVSVDDSHNGLSFAADSMTYSIPYTDDTAPVPCVYYEKSINAFTDTGCGRIRRSDTSVISCECTHLTSFGVLTGGSSAVTAGDKSHQTALSVIT